MKKMIVLSIAMTAAIIAFAQEKTDAFKVYGNCGMCKKRIEKAAKLDGVISAVWNADTKIITVTYDEGKVSNDDLQKKIAAVGHDTEKYTAEDKVYEKLPGCCLYERKKADAKTGHSSHNH